jgi:F-type H+-transporting ATPase subunit gamma
MATLKELRTRINSVKATQKITSAMKMVAASKLRRAQEAAEAARPYADRMERMVRSLADSLAGNESAPAMLAGTGEENTHLLIVATSDRGLCGGFNSSIVRAARRRIEALIGDGATVKLFLIGRKAGEQLRRAHDNKIISAHEGIGTRRVSFAEAAVIAQEVAQRFEDGEFDICTIYYNHFKSAISQVVTPQQLIPFASIGDGDNDGGDDAAADDENDGAIYEFEPSEEEILEDLLPRNMAVQIFRALLENAASEQGSRMMAMDNATRNAGEMIDKLSLTYNRSRQAAITKELIEIVSGAEAL